MLCTDSDGLMWSSCFHCLPSHIITTCS